MTVEAASSPPGQRKPGISADRGNLGEGELRTSEVLWLVGRALSYVWPFKYRFLVNMAFAIGAVLPIFYTPWPLKVLTDHVIQGDPLTREAIESFPWWFNWFLVPLENAPAQQIALWVILLGAVTVLLFGAFGQGPAATDDTTGDLAQGQDTATRTENVANYARSWASGLYGILDFIWMLRLSQALNHYYRAKLFDRVKALPMVTLEDSRIGDSIYRLMYDTPMITSLCYNIFRVPLVSLLSFAGICYILMVQYDAAPEILYVAIALFPLFIISTSLFSGYVRRRSFASRSSGARTTSTIEEGMTNVLAVQSLGGWKRERERFERDSAASFKQFRGFALSNYAWTAAVLGIGMAATYATMYIVATNIIAGRFTVGDYAVILFYYAMMTRYARDFSTTWIDLQDNVIALRRVFELMDKEAEIDHGTRDLGPITKGVTVDNATLVYPDGRKALDSVSFQAPIGEVVAIVGPTGAGKTSLAYLIPGFHRPTSGRVLIDGVDLATVKIDTARTQIAYVFQETHLFSASIADNIRYAKPDASQAEVERVAKMAGAHDFIMALPEGYATDLGARGGKLSVGQKQRISIARGLLRDSKVLILDEPTSALDPETEKYLVASLQEAAKNRAVVIIAHRLSTISKADRIVFLEDGKVREEGSPAALLSNPNGAYSHFLKLQTSTDEPRAALQRNCNRRQA